MWEASGAIGYRINIPYAKKGRKGLWVVCVARLLPDAPVSL